MIRQEARLVPTTFLYATERRLRSSTESSPPIYDMSDLHFARGTVCVTYVCNLFHEVDHFIVALGLLAEPCEEGFAGCKLA